MTRWKKIVLMVVVLFSVIGLTGCQDSNIEDIEIDEPDESIQTEDKSVIWVKEPFIVFDKIIPIAPYYRIWAHNIEQELTGYSVNFDENDYTPNAVEVKRFGKYGIYDYDGNKLQDIVAEYGLDYAFVPKFFVFGVRDSEMHFYSKLSTDFKELIRSDDGYGIGGVPDIFVYRQGTIYKDEINGLSGNYNFSRYSEPDSDSYMILPQVDDNFNYIGNAILCGNKLQYTSTDNICPGTFINGKYLVSESPSSIEDPYFVTGSKESRLAFVNAETGEHITDYLYDDALFFEDGYAPVEKEGYWGFIDEEGNEVTNFIFTDASPLYDGKSWVAIDGVYGIIDLSETLNQEIPVTKETTKTDISQSLIEEAKTRPIFDVTVHVADLNIRSGPGTSYDRVGTATYFDRFSVYETRQDSAYTWYRIGTDKWIADDGTWLQID